MSCFSAVKNHFFANIEYLAGDHSADDHSCGFVLYPGTASWLYALTNLRSFRIEAFGNTTGIQPQITTCFPCQLPVFLSKTLD